jgi:hypothetical protein
MLSIARDTFGHTRPEIHRKARTANNPEPKTRTLPLGYSLNWSFAHNPAAETIRCLPQAVLTTQLLCLVRTSSDPPVNEKPSWSPRRLFSCFPNRFAVFPLAGQSLGNLRFHRPPENPGNEPPPFLSGLGGSLRPLSLYRISGKDPFVSPRRDEPPWLVSARTTNETDCYRVMNAGKMVPNKCKWAFRPRLR